jgi:hypothetical protein
MIVGRIDDDNDDNDDNGSICEPKLAAGANKTLSTVAVLTVIFIMPTLSILPTTYV